MLTKYTEFSELIVPNDQIWGCFKISNFVQEEYWYKNHFLLYQDRIFANKLPLSTLKISEPVGPNYQIWGDLKISNFVQEGENDLLRSRSFVEGRKKLHVLFSFKGGSEFVGLL